MSATAQAILDVDLLRYERGDADARRAVVDGVTRSLRTGFVYASHDVSQTLIDDAYGMLADFFHKDRETKERYVAPGSMGQTGYTGLLVEAAASADRPDWKEMLNWGIELPEGHPLRRAFPHRYMPRVFPDDAVPGIGKVLVELYERLLDLQVRFLRIIAEGLGLHPTFFDGMLKDGPTLARAIRYPPMDAAPQGQGPFIWAEEHGDINLITALPRATARGLQVKTEGQWLDVAPPDDAAVLNTGLMLELVSNGRIPVGLHRVISDPDQTGERFSVVQFCHPTPRTILSPVASCIDARTPQRYSAIQAGDWLDQVLYDINLVEGARRLEQDGDAD